MLRSAWTVSVCSTRYVARASSHSRIEFMPLIKGGRFVEDGFVAIADGDPLPASANPIVPLERFLKERETLLGRNSPFGVRLKSNENPEELRDDIERISVVALEFPNFRDGRAFSKARALRTRLGFKGEVR